VNIGADATVVTHPGRVKDRNFARPLQAIPGHHDPTAGVYALSALSLHDRLPMMGSLSETLLSLA